MSPNGDMPDAAAQHDSFSLANIVPQNPNNNRHLWAAIEIAVREAAKREGELYVITGPAFIGTDIEKIGNVLVPTHLFKVIYLAHEQLAGAYFVANEDNAQYAQMTVSDLEKIVGLNLLPGVSERVKEAGMTLPNPYADGVSVAHWNKRERKKSRKIRDTSEGDGSDHPTSESNHAVHKNSADNDTIYIDGKQMLRALKQIVKSLN